jgi:cell division transport system ATP-binding protein
MIRFQSITKQFGDSSPALENVSFDVNNGEFIFLTGHSGSGKTTLMKLLTKEYQPTSGDIQFDGTPLSKIKGGKVHQHRRKIGVVFQDYRLLPELNVWENIALALQIIGKPQHEIEERVTDLLDLVQLVDKAYNFPAELSGGESQRVGIARALATAPGVLLADEPTGNLDPQTTLMIAKLFSKIHQLGTTILFATHDISILSTLNYRRIHLDKGRIVSDSGQGQTPPPAAGLPPQNPSVPQAKMEETSPPKKLKKKLLDDAEDTKDDEPEVHHAPSGQTRLKQEDLLKKKKKGFHLPTFKLPFFSGKKTQKETPHSSQSKDSDSKQTSKPSANPIETEMKEVLVQVEDLDAKK